MQILIALLVAASITCPDAVSQAESEAQTKALIACWKNQTVALERSGESPNDIATAAIIHCGDHIRIAVVSFGKCRGGSFDHKLKTTLESRIRDAVIADVVTIRSKKR